MIFATIYNTFLLVFFLTTILSETDSKPVFNAWPITLYVNEIDLPIRVFLHVLILKPCQECEDSILIQSETSTSSSNTSFKRIF